MKYIMKLNPKYFEYMKNGTKRIEIRLNDEKRRKIKIGDTIIFQKEPELKEEINTQIVNLIVKKNFKQLIETLDISEYADEKETQEKFLEDLYRFYTKEQEEKYGVVGIQIKKAGLINKKDRVLAINEAIENFRQEEKVVIEPPVFIKKEFLYNMNLNDDFFSTLRFDYKDFDKWFIKKQKNGEMAYITRTRDNKITSFLMLKEEDENEDYSAFEKPFNPAKRIKVSTFKVSDTGKKIGECFIKIMVNEAIQRNGDEIYITTFEKQESLIYLLKQYGFELFTYKNTTKSNGTVEKEAIYVKNMKDKSQYL